MQLSLSAVMALTWLLLAAVVGALTVHATPTTHRLESSVTLPSFGVHPVDQIGAVIKPGRGQASQALLTWMANGKSSQVGVLLTSDNRAQVVCRQSVVNPGQLFDESKATTNIRNTHMYRSHEWENGVSFVMAFVEVGDTTHLDVVVSVPGSSRPTRLCRLENVANTGGSLVMSVVGELQDTKAYGKLPMAPATTFEHLWYRTVNQAAPDEAALGLVPIIGGTFRSKITPSWPLSSQLGKPVLSVQQISLVYYFNIATSGTSDGPILVQPSPSVIKQQLRDRNSQLSIDAALFMPFARNEQQPPTAAQPASRPVHNAQLPSTSQPTHSRSRTSLDSGDARLPFKKRPRVQDADIH